MAAVATRGKAPVAGQPGFDINRADGADTSMSSEISTIEQEQAVRPVQPKVKRQPTKQEIESAKKGSAKDLLDHLKQTGTNPEKLQDADQWALENDGATAEQCYRYLEDAELFGHRQTSPGTLKKAGKYLWGDGWEPESAQVMTPTEESVALRKKVNDKDMEIAQKNAEIASLHAQLEIANRKAKDYGAENDLLRRGNQADAAGAGKNALLDANAPV